MTTSPAPRAAVAGAIQNLMATRLGRGFVPFGAIFVWGIVRFATGASALVAVGALASGVAMLAYGLRVVQRAMGRPPRVWMTVASLGAVVPPLFTVYVVGWLGLRGFTLGFTPPALLTATLGVVLGVWALRGWLRIVEIERLARIMMVNLDGEGGAA